MPSFGPPPSTESAFFQYFWHNGVKEYVDYMAKNYRPGFTYADFASEFKAEFFDPNQWAELFEASRARHANIEYTNLFLV